MNEFLDSNHYETEFCRTVEDQPVQAPFDDRDDPDPDFKVNEELAFNLGVEEPRI